MGESPFLGFESSQIVRVLFPIGWSHIMTVSLDSYLVISGTAVILFQYKYWNLFTSHLYNVKIVLANLQLTFCFPILYFTLHSWSMCSAFMFWLPLLWRISFHRVVSFYCRLIIKINFYKLFLVYWNQVDI